MARPRSVKSHQKVLDAATELFADRGIEGASMDAIAERSGVSKATIYKYWRDKEALCIEVLLHLHGIDDDHTPTYSGDTRKDLLDVLASRPKPEFAEVRARIMPHLIAYSALNETFGQAWRHRVMMPAREKLTRVLETAMARGEIEPIETEHGLAMLLGPMLYCHVLRRPIDGMPEAVLDCFWRAYARPAGFRT